MVGGLKLLGLLTKRLLQRQMKRLLAAVDAQAA